MASPRSLRSRAKVQSAGGPSAASGPASGSAAGADVAPPQLPRRSQRAAAVRKKKKSAPAPTTAKKKPRGRQTRTAKKAAAAARGSDDDEYYFSPTQAASLVVRRKKVNRPSALRRGDRYLHDAGRIYDAEDREDELRRDRRGQVWVTDDGDVRGGKFAEMGENWDDDAGSIEQLRPDEVDALLNGAGDAAEVPRQTNGKGRQRQTSEHGLLDLPYHAIVSILEFAAHPIAKNDNVRWLLQMMHVCRDFAEPAVTVLYSCPPLLPAARAHRLARLLNGPREAVMFNYWSKVTSVKIDVGQLAKPVWNSQHLDYRALIRGLPRLSELEFYHEKDMPPYRSLGDNIRWEYPTGLFEVLGIQLTVPPGDQPIPDSTAHNEKIRLRSWRWSSRMMGAALPLSRLHSIHQAPCFSGLRKLAFVNFQVPSLRAPNRDVGDPALELADEVFTKALAYSLESLPDLKHLIFESSTVVTGSLLALLPKTLEHLELINCWDVREDEMSEYLEQGGRHLRQLTLLHNQSLSLKFLPLLGWACPQLVHLHINMTYFKHHEAYNDSDPNYEYVLDFGQVPTWPSTLQTILIEHIRRWSPDTAEMFFGSLIDGAPNLPHLRRLDISAVLDIPWRARSQLRDKWISMFDEVYIRKTEDPKAQPPKKLAVAANRAGESSKKRRRTDEDEQPSSRRRKLTLADRTRKSSRLAAGVGSARPGRASRVSYREPDTDDELDLADDSDGDDSDAEAARATTSISRLVLAGRDDDADADAEMGGSGSRASPPAPRGAARFVQGMCNFVEIRIDNQKPVEQQFAMEDFIDSENPQSEASWDPEEDWEDDTAYAW